MLRKNVYSMILKDFQALFMEVPDVKVICCVVKKLQLSEYLWDETAH